MKLILDTDAGIDDAEALMLALHEPGVEVVAITTLTGNVHVDKVCANVNTILDVMNADVPFYRGAQRSLVQVEGEGAEYAHGSDGLGDMPNRIASSRQSESEHAVNALVRLVNEAPGEYKLLAIGPLTNIALAIHLDPDFPKKVKSFSYMGGTIAGRGNTPNIAAEFNIFADPEAAYVVMNAFEDMTMLSWETTIWHPFTWEAHEKLCQIDTPRGRFYEAMTRKTRTLYRQQDTYGGSLLPDPLAMAITLRPELIAEQQHLWVTTEMGGTHARGQTILDYDGYSGNAPNTHVVTKLDIDAVYQMFVDMLNAD